MSALTFLGTGTSHGVPVIGCTCAVCTSLDPRNQRYRSSVLFEKEGFSLLIDTSPEFRLQALRANLHSLDAVLYTHDHADHFNGIDDLRVYCNDRRLPVYGSKAVEHAIESRFSYTVNSTKGGIPHLDMQVLQAGEPTAIGPFTVTAVPILHGKDTIYGYRVDSVAYLTDCSEVPPESLKLLDDLSVLVVGALRGWPHPNHYSVFEATALGKLLGPKAVFFTHLSHHLDHQKLEESLPPSFSVAYDGLRLTLKEYL